MMRTRMSGPLLPTVVAAPGYDELASPKIDETVVFAGFDVYFRRCSLEGAGGDALCRLDPRSAWSVVRVPVPATRVSGTWYMAKCLRINKLYP